MATEPQTIEDVSQNMGVQQEKQPAPLYANPNMVYSTSNIQKASAGPQKAPDYAGMSVDNLAKEIAKAQNASDLEQINISNQPIRQGVITGQSAYAQKLADYRLGALGRLYSAKETKLARENEEKDKFIELYGADPGMRPKGMSKREFSKALQAGKFQDLVVAAFKDKYSKKGGTSTYNSLKNPATGLVNQMVAKHGDDWGAIASELQSQGYDTGTGGDIDVELNRRFNPENYQKLNMSPAEREVEEFSTAENYVTENKNLSDEELKSNLLKMTGLTATNVNAIIKAERSRSTEDVKSLGNILVEGVFDKDWWRFRDRSLPLVGSEFNIAKNNAINFIDEARNSGNTINFQGSEIYLTDSELKELEDYIIDLKLSDINI